MQLGKLFDIHQTLLIHRLQQDLHSVEINFVMYASEVHVHANCLQ